MGTQKPVITKAELEALVMEFSGIPYQVWVRLRNTIDGAFKQQLGQKQRQAEEEEEEGVLEITQNTFDENSRWFDRRALDGTTESQYASTLFARKRNE